MICCSGPDGRHTLGGRPPLHLQAQDWHRLPWQVQTHLIKQCWARLKITLDRGWHEFSQDRFGSPEERGSKEEESLFHCWWPGGWLTNHFNDFIVTTSTSRCACLGWKVSWGMENTLDTCDVETTPIILTRELNHDFWRGDVTRRCSGRLVTGTCPGLTGRRWRRPGWKKATTRLRAEGGNMRLAGFLSSLTCSCESTTKVKTVTKFSFPGNTGKILCSFYFMIFWLF